MVLLSNLTYITKQFKQMRGVIREVVTTIIVAVVIFLVLQATIQSFVVIGSSMRPNFEPRQRLLVSKVAYRFGEPQRGEVIVFRPPNNKDIDYIKRVIALPGDKIEIKEGTVYINNVALDEPYIKKPTTDTLRPTEIPEDEYFVLGDNRNNSNDSYDWGTVPRQNIVGKAWISVWPPDQWGVTAHYSPQE
jgi:signal peptidase I